MNRARVPEAEEVQELSDDKMMATVFLNANDVIVLDFLLKRSKITGVNHEN